MSLVLKSNRRVTLPSLNDVVPDAKLKMDFRTGEYVLNNATLGGIEDAVTSARQSPAGKYNISGEWSEVLENTPRVSVDQGSLKKGLLLEASFTNTLHNSMTPATQTQSVVIGTTVSGLLSVAGSGSAVLTVDSEVIGTAYEGYPISYKPTVTGTKSVTVTVTGSLSYFGFYITTEARERVSRIATLSSSATFDSGLASINSNALLQAVGSNFSGCLVVRQFFPDDVFDRSVNSPQSGTIAQIRGAGDTGIYIARQENGNLRNILRVKSAAEQFAHPPASLALKNTYALNFSKTYSKLAVNGVLGNSLTFPEITPTDIHIGSGNSWSTNVTNYIEEVLVFDRHLTDEEMIAITT